MWAGRPQILLSLVLLAAGLLCSGCEQLDPYRQGLKTKYREELRQLALDTKNKDGAKDLETAENTPAADAAADEVTQINYWHAPSLLSAIRLQPPEPYAASPLQLP
jgi:hypothetical protein